MTFLKAALCVVAVTLLSAHVAPSVDDNNRYLKVTPLQDGFRLAYTVFFGEIPGASERRKIDANRDSRIDDAEAKRFADKLGSEVAASIDVEIDGVPQRVQWSVVSPGMGSDAVAAGSFSIDLVAFFCVPGTTGPSRHRVRVRDQFRIPKPGETEVKVEDSPGITIQRARVGAAEDPSHDFRFAGPGGPLSDDGLDLEYVATDKAPTVPNGACAGAGPAATHDSRTMLLVVITAIALLIGAGGWLVWRRRSRADRSTADTSSNQPAPNRSRR
jgi:hypothetical protein